MKIGIDARCLMQKNYSGVSWYTFNLLEALFSLDQENEYILFYNNSKPVDMPKFKGNNVKYVSFKYPNKLLNQSFNLFKKPEIDKMIGGVDMLFMPNINFMASSKDCKRIVTVHDLSYLRYPQFWTLKSRMWHKILIKKRILQDADAIIAVSKSTKDDLVDLLGIDENKIKVIYEGVDNKFRPITNPTELERVKRKYKLPSKFILYLGTLEPRKNVDGIIEAFNNLDLEHKLVLGGGNGWKSHQTRKIASRNSDIRLIGYVDEEDKRGLYSLADLFVYPSYYEGFGLPPIEAMACGLPTIAGANSSQLEVLDSAGLLVDAHNTGEITEAIKAILTQSNLRDKLIDSGLNRSAQFNWGSTAINTLRVFNDIMKR